jgi:uncharacterized repeat protein (TIGR03806 family)
MSATAPFAARRRLRLGLGLAAMIAVPVLTGYGLDAPVPVGTFLNGVLPSRTPTGVARWTVRPAFPALTFDDTTVIRPAPNSNRLYVGSREGVIWSFVNHPSTATKDLFLDISNRVAVVWDGGFLGLAFHPEFGVPGSPNRGRVYTYYCATYTGNYPRNETAGFFNVYLRLSRFRVPDGSLAADPNSEEILFNFRLYNSSHRGGDIAFGPDGYLYVPIGEQFNFETAQDIANNLEGGILRIDVDQDPTRSHAPRRKLPLGFADESSGRHYWIPNDNPFLDPNGSIFEEYYSLGHRNPHRLTFDPLTGRLWSGEIGSWMREEVNVIVKGGNYGWPFREGLTGGPRPQPPTIIGTLRQPAIDFARTEARAIIGGYVYRGSAHSTLEGTFLCGDFIHRNIWALTYNADTNVATKELLTTYDPDQLTTFGQDHAREVYLGGLGLGRPIYKLAAVIDYVGDAPPLLSQTGAFTDLPNLTPAPGLIPYDVNSPLWSDGAAKRRWIAIPNDGTHDTLAETIRFSADGNWDFPVGTVLIKHFDMPIDERNPTILRRLETRFLIKGVDNRFYGLTYRWRTNGSDADLLTEGAQEQITVQTARGTRNQIWVYPDRNQCLTCHTTAAGSVLGVRTHQLNRPFEYEITGRTDNQIRTWNHLRIFAAPLDEARIPTLPSAVAIDDMSASLDKRARSYLDANCASCHRPGTANRSPIDARLGIPLFAQQIVRGSVLDDLGTPGSKVAVPHDLTRSVLHKRMATPDPNLAMPPLARNLVDEAAAELIKQWIGDLDPTLQPIPLGNPIDPQPSNDTWFHNLVVDESDTYANTSGLVEEIRVAAFRFQAAAQAGPVTPFVVKVLGDNDFRVAAIGTTRLPGQYATGANVFRFADGLDPAIRLLPGETLAFGCLDAFPDGTGGAAGGVIPWCACNGGDQVWRTGGPDPDAPRLTLGQMPLRGPLTEDATRDYAFAVDMYVHRRAGSSGLFGFGLDEPFQLGHWLADGTLDPWQASLVVDPGSSYTNRTSAPQAIDVMLFRFWASQIGSPITPFVVKVNGPDDFRIVAIGSTRRAPSYVPGPNLFFFHDSGLVRIVLWPGETLATGFLDAEPDGTGGTAPVIPYRSGNAVWFSGGPTPADAGRLRWGLAPVPGTQVQAGTVARSYSYAIDFLLR